MDILWTWRVLKSCPLLDGSGVTHAVEAAAVEDILTFTVIFVARFCGSMLLEGILSSVEGTGVLSGLPVCCYKPFALR